MLPWMPHWHCLINLWLIIPMATSDFAIFFAYWMISAELLRQVRKSPASEYAWQNHAFALFIRLCGLTHLMGVVVLWWAVYPLQLMVNLATAGVSVLVWWLYRTRMLELSVSRATRAA